MFTSEEINTIVRRKIEADESLGVSSSATEHLSFSDYQVEEINSIMLPDEQLEIRYLYTLTVESEFTSYPDHPPMEYPRYKLIIVNKDKEIIHEEELTIPDNYSSSGTDFNWELVKRDIINLVAKLADHIKTETPPQTTPFLTAPNFEVKRRNNKAKQYVCYIESAESKKDGFTVEADTPLELLAKIRMELKNRYGFGKPGHAS